MNCDIGTQFGDQPFTALRNDVLSNEALGPEAVALYAFIVAAGDLDPAAIKARFDWTAEELAEFMGQLFEAGAFRRVV